MEQRTTFDDLAFYRRWILANGWAEAAGLGTTFVIGQQLAPLLERMSGTHAVLGTAALAVVFGMVLEGVLVGAAQEGVLRRRVTGLPRWSWTAATAAGAALAWLVGMVPSTVMALMDATSSTPPPSEPPALVRYALALGLGAIAGPILGLAQWIVLRRVVARAGRWLWANAVAWAAGMDAVPWTAHPAIVAVAIYAVCAVAGMAVGGIHGRVLLSLLPPRPSRGA